MVLGSHDEHSESSVCVHPSDRSSPYASKDYQDRLKKYKVVGSMSRNGHGDDIGYIESFHSVIKREFIHVEKRIREDIRPAVSYLQPHRRTSIDEGAHYITVYRKSRVCLSRLAATDEKN